ncbi:hypothetical protein EVAR_29692_1 [Eumeta japonica]|uniref:Uncharacterized protein n=1 Tax=Eumeta variegata TaxID=151549 RepID=A0A4C1VY20_EUMVA|nr:hypothetical protein EVAR_29692_1 [Eumeta japonica]
MSQNRLNSLAIMAIENDVLEKGAPRRALPRGLDVHNPALCAIDLRWERPPPGVPTVRPPICACVSTQQDYSAPRSYSTTGDHASTSHTARNR